ncbi:prolyl 3-hydroxylase OGFOD1 [Caerostris extrusa]|uniref:uS12 prolyl 3-hydroxylase n=1 Tax=Caerostris extrusa TaxID=172846 RepID=A0AAV4R897_CAEEX|nr:prolyl 3-hydroxylase OGFOD1 [Caerostris extrusa]
MRSLCYCLFSKISAWYLEIRTFASIWYNKKAFVKRKELHFENGAKIISNPFTCCVLPDFLQPKEFTENLKEEIEEIEVELKLSDLYQFKQSKDLSTCTDRSISLLRDMIYGAFLEWMKRITNIPLNDKVDISCSCYTHTDHLLCHDDELEGRRIAYIYYLVPEWEKEYGGRLDLFNMVNGTPSDIATSFIPKWNNLIFFEVSPVSYHQVSEITAYKTRTSISGWFYGPPMKRNVRPTESILFQSPSSIPVDILQWINPTYLAPESQTKIRHSFEESSEIELQDFFRKKNMKKSVVF